MKNKARFYAAQHGVNFFRTSEALIVDIFLISLFFSVDLCFPDKHPSWDFITSLYYYGLNKETITGCWPGNGRDMPDRFLLRFIVAENICGSFANSLIRNERSLAYGKVYYSALLSDYCETCRPLGSLSADFLIIQLNWSRNQIKILPKTIYRVFLFFSSSDLNPDFLPLNKRSGDLISCLNHVRCLSHSFYYIIRIIKILSLLASPR